MSSTLEGIEVGNSHNLRTTEGEAGADKDVEKQPDEKLAVGETEPGSVNSLPRDEKPPNTVDPFGDEEGAEVQYRTMKWWQAAALMIAETVSLGILSLPSVLATIGLVPGVILLVVLGVLASYTGYVIGQFKAKYPQVHTMADAGEIMFGSLGREIFGVGQTVFIIFTMASHILTFNIAMNTMTSHATCTVVWGIIGAVVMGVMSMPRTMKNISWSSIVSFISILSAVMITMIGVGVDPPDPHVQATVTVGFAPAFLAVTNICFAYSGHVAFFTFISELKDPNDFPKALAMLQISDSCLYMIVAVVVYRYAGVDVASPALGSTSPVVKKIAYGIALPTIIIAGVVYGHVGAKYIYVRIFRGTKHMSQRTWKSSGTWLAIIAIIWVIAFVIAESIPTFNSMLGIISSLLGSWFTYGISGMLWLYLNRGRYTQNWKKMCLCAVNWFLIAMAALIMVAGMYASGKAIHDDSGTGSWTCADNSQ